MTFISELQTFVQGRHPLNRKVPFEWSMNEIWQKGGGVIYASDKEFTYSSVMILTFDKQTP